MKDSVGEEEEFHLHDIATEGISVDWKKARKLYNKIKGVETMPGQKDEARRKVAERQAAGNTTEQTAPPAATDAPPEKPTPSAGGDGDDESKTDEDGENATGSDLESPPVKFSHQVAIVVIALLVFSGLVVCIFK